MCRKEIYTLKISNRGTGAQTIVTNETFCVNVPQPLRRNQDCMITIIDGSIVMDTTIATFQDYHEVGFSCDLPIMGCNTEIPSGFTFTGYNQLYQVNLNAWHTTAITQPLKPNNMATYRCGGIPEKLTFWRSIINGSSTEARLTYNGYFSCTMQIEFLNEYDE